MKRVEWIWDEFVYGGHWGSLAAPAIALSVIILLSINIKWEFLLIVYLGTHCIYLYNRYKEMDIDKTNNLPRVIHLKRYDRLLPSITAFYGVTYLSLLIFFGNKTSIFFGGLLLLIGLAFTNGVKKSSKNIAYLKSIYISLSWGMLVFFTALYHSLHINLSIFFAFAFVFLRMSIDTIFYDIKDTESDKKIGLLTLPILFNDRIKLLNFLNLLNVISFLPVGIGVMSGLLPIYSLFLIFAFFYDLYYIQRAKDEKADIQSICYFLVDGEYCYWPILLLIGKLITSL